MDYKKILDQSLPIIEQTGEFIRSEFGRVSAGSIEVKSKNSLVSYVDKGAEKMLVDGLGGILPEAVFLTEEDTVANQEGTWRWIIDPLDGTTNFLHALPIFAISVGLEYRGKIVLGIVQSVYLQEIYYAWQGGGAYLNGQRIRVTEQDRLEDSLLATGFPYYDYSRGKDYLQVLSYFMQHTRGIRRYGAAAIDLAYVAAGRFDGFFEYALNPWDVAAGIILIEEAGGRVSDFGGGDQHLSGQEVVASNGKIHPSMLEQVAVLKR